MRGWSALLGVLLCVVGWTASWAAEDCAHTGTLLVAAPAMEDPNFRVSVVLLLSHDATHARGVIVNRMVARGALGEAGEGCGLTAGAALERPVSIHFGGPLLPHTARVIHSADFSGATTCAMGEGVAVSNGCEVLRAVAAGGGPERYLILRGMAQWEAGQLEDEVTRGWWRRVPFDAGLVLEEPDVIKWHKARRLSPRTASPDT